MFPFIVCKNKLLNQNIGHESFLWTAIGQNSYNPTKASYSTDINTKRKEMTFYQNLISPGDWVCSILWL